MKLPHLFFLLAWLLLGVTSASAFYHPETGRWLNRDPLGEAGGLNLYAYCHNDPVNKYDYLGLETISQLEAQIEELEWLRDIVIEGMVAGGYVEPLMMGGVARGGGTTSQVYRQFGIEIGKRRDRIRNIEKTVSRINRWDGISAFVKGRPRNNPVSADWLDDTNPDHSSWFGASSDIATVEMEIVTAGGVSALAGGKRVLSAGGRLSSTLATGRSPLIGEQLELLLYRLGALKYVTDPKARRLLGSKGITNDIQVALRRFLDGDASSPLAQLRRIDPNARFGLRGSSATGKVGNPNKPRFGEPIDPDDFDLDLFIQSDDLFQKFGGELIEAPGLRAALFKEFPDLFRGLRDGGKGVSIKIFPSNGDLGSSTVFFD